ncbi:MAG TPA: glycosyltransferase family 39 protein [Solirubrobacteraceae bacterium]|nr:glycosyltransferase family 39 protein [Solirubrobacteraceae bacterium]
MSSAALGSTPSRSHALAGARAQAWALAALTLLALALRLTSLSRSLFTDEAYSLALAQRSFGHMVVLFGYEANGTLYSIVLWPLIRLFGDGEQLLRAPAVLAGAASVPAMWWAARQLAPGRVVPLTAAALLAINPMAVWYSQEARAYSFVVLAACLAFGSLARAVHGPGGGEDGRGPAGPAGARPGARAAWIGYVAAMAAMAYCDLFAAPLALPAQLLLVRSGGREAMRGWRRALLALLACCLPLLVASGISRSRRDALYWLPKTDRALVELGIQEFTGGFSGVSAVGWLTVLVGAALLAAVLWRSRGGGDAERDGRALRARLAVAATWALAPAALLLAVSFVKPVFWPRYAIVSVPGLCLLVALLGGALTQGRASPGALMRGPRSLGARGGFGAACVAAIVALALYADTRQVHEIQENWRPIAAWLRAERPAGTPTIVDNALVLPSLGYYDPAFSAANGDLVVQEWRDEALPTGFVGFKDRTGYGSVPDGPPSAQTFARLARRGSGSVWMIVSEVDDDLQANPREGAAVAWARSHCRVEVRESTGVWALRASRCAASAPS